MMKAKPIAHAILASLLWLFAASGLSQAQQWRVDAITQNDLQYIEQQHQRIDTLARRHLGRQLQGNPANDIPLLQALLDQQLVRPGQTLELQAMGIILGQLLKQQYGLLWVIYEDKLGRSRALQVAGINEFIFPATQISRRVEVGIEISVQEQYRKLEQAVRTIKAKPRTLL